MPPVAVPPFAVLPVAAARWPSGANLPALRGHNSALVLDLLRIAGSDGISRRELADRTGLTPQAVSKITGRLRAEGLAAPAGRRASTGGKPPTALRLVPGARHAVGLHLDRDACTAVLADLTGTVVAERHGPLDLGAGADEVVDLAVREVRALTAAVRTVGATAVGGPGAAPTRAAVGEPATATAPDAMGGPGAAVPPPTGGLLGAGVAVPGPLDHRLGVLHRVTGFPEWDGFPLRDVLARRLGMPVAVDKDTNAAALGISLWTGPGPSGPHSFAYLHLGTGLGAGLVLDGAVRRGARTGAGEFGHQVILLEGPRCSCGNRGCVEALCLAAVARGDLDGAARVLGEAAANLIALLDVDHVLLGGAAINAGPGTGESFVRGVATVLAERARRTGADQAVPVTVAPGGPRAVAEGAAQLLLAPLFGRAAAPPAAPGAAGASFVPPTPAPASAAVSPGPECPRAPAG